MDEGSLERRDPEAVAHLLLGALTQAGMVVARAGDPRDARRTMGAALLRLVGGLRCR